MRTPSHAGRHPPEGRTHPRRQVFSHNGVPDGKVLYRQVAALKDGLAARADPFGVAAPLLHAQLAWLMHPQELSERMASLTTDLWQLQWHVHSQFDELFDRGAGSLAARQRHDAGHPCRP